MCKDILKIMSIYLKQYSIMLIILLIAFSTFAATTTNKQLNKLKNGVAVYDFQLTNILMRLEHIYIIFQVLHYGHFILIMRI